MYGAGLLLAVFCLMAMALKMDSALISGLLAVACICTAIGVVIRLTSLVKRAWQCQALRRAALLFHLAVLFLVAIIARNVMTAATGLPGQDFTLASSALTLPLYPFVWLWLVAILAGVTTIGLQICLIIMFFMRPVSSNRSQETDGKDTGSSGSGHWIGLARFVGTLTIFGSLMAAFEYASSFNPELKGVARVVAYYADYQAASRYPGIPVNERVLMHANGVYSTARRLPGGGVSIDVHYWQGPGASTTDQKPGDLTSSAAASVGP